MLGKILAPLDGSTLAEVTLPHIVALNRINGTNVTLLHVLETQHTQGVRMAPTQVDPVEWNLRKAEGQSYLEEIANRLQPHDMATETVVLQGQAAERIVDYAQKEEFNLIALSSHGQGGLSGWNLSSVASKVVYRSRKSLLVIPAHRSMTQHHTKSGEQGGELRSVQYQRILVPLDGSQRSECVLPLAEALARQHGAELILVHVVTPPEMIHRMPLSADDVALLTRIVDRNRMEATHYLEQIHAQLAPLASTRILNSDNVERALLQLAESESVDLIILAAHGSSGYNGRVYGHLVTSLINDSSVPLYIHQDFNINEMKPLYAEQMLQAPNPLLTHQAKSIYWLSSGSRPHIRSSVSFNHSGGLQRQVPPQVSVPVAKHIPYHH